MNRKQRRAAKAVPQKQVHLPEVYPLDATGPSWEELPDKLPKVLEPTQFATPGTGIRRIVYPDPTTGEPVVGFRKDPLSVMYKGETGQIRTFTDGASLGEFLSLAGRENLQIVSRQERRRMFREEKQRLRERQKRQQAEVQRILTEAKERAGQTAET